METTVAPTQALPACTLRFEALTTAPANLVLAAAYDFGERRERIWPNVKTRYLEVHHHGETTAEVTEGTRLGWLWWERCRYDWSRPGEVIATVLDSNVYEPGVSGFEWRAATRPEGGSQVEMVLHRTFRRGPRGWAPALLYRGAGRWLFASMLKDVLRSIEADA